MRATRCSDHREGVPIDIELGRSFDTLVITGPNTAARP